MESRFDFERYVELKKSPTARKTQRGGFGEYAYSADLRVLRSLSYARPVRLSVEASVRAFKAWKRSDILGSSVKVSGRQFPRLYDLVAECASELHIPVPTVYVTHNFAQIRLSTLGTETDSFIVIQSATVDRMDDAELKFALGRECGRIQNSHVAYHTALQFLTDMTAPVVKWAVTPARMALMGWSRRAEITVDRAGLICCRDLDVATRTVVKLAVGSQSLVDEIDVDAYLAQVDDIRRGVGRVSEYFQKHPYLPKRLQALQAFGQSEYYRRLVKLDGGLSLADVDKRVDQIVSVL